MLFPDEKSRDAIVARLYLMVANAMVTVNKSHAKIGEELLRVYDDADEGRRAAIDAAFARLTGHPLRTLMRQCWDREYRET